MSVISDLMSRGPKEAEGAASQLANINYLRWLAQTGQSLGRAVFGIGSAAVAEECRKELAQQGPQADDPAAA